MRRNCTEENLRLYAITDKTWVNGGTLAGQVEEALRGGATMIQYREKDGDEEKIRQEALDIKLLCHKYNVPFLIDDRVMLAREIGADGVHIGQDDMSVTKARSILGPDKIIGVTAKTVEQALLAKEQGADYLGSGAVFGTTTKVGAKPMELATLKAICEAVSIPVVAIGGINGENVLSLKDTGIAGVAVIKGIFGEERIEESTRSLLCKVRSICHKPVYKALTIAGSDCSGGAGIQADLKTMMANGVYAMSAITALTAQNTTGVYGISETSADFLAQQIDCIFQDIRPDAVKIGMVSSEELIETIAKKLSEYKAEHIVVDPVMVSTSGSKLLKDSAVDSLTAKLFPLAEVITPNIPEAEILSAMKITNKEEMIEAAKVISEKYGCNVLLKGGHFVETADDLLYEKGDTFHWFNGIRIDNSNTHGTGCTLSSAIASNLAKGYSLHESVNRAKNYISEALADMLDIGKGSGPMNHGFCITRTAE